MSPVDWSKSQYDNPWQSPGFRFWQSFLTWQRELNAALAPYGLTQPQFSILTVVGWLARNDEPITQQAIADFTQMDRMHVSQVVRKLESLGYLERRKSPNDGRTRIVTMTSGGTIKIQETLPIVEQIDAQHISR